MAVTVLNHVDRDDSITSTVEFTNASGTPTNPTTVRFATIDPTGPASETIYEFGVDAEVTNPVAGTFVFTVPMTISGVWEIKAVGTGAVNEAVRGIVKVDSDPFSI